MAVGVETGSCQISKCSCQGVKLMYVSHTHAERFSSIKFRDVWGFNAIIYEEHDSCIHTCAHTSVIHPSFNGNYRLDQ
jgi:hypothetical protein